MITATTIAGPRGAVAGATAATPGLAGGTGLDFSALMGGVLADAAVPPVPDASVAMPMAVAAPADPVVPDVAAGSVGTIVVSTPVDPVTDAAAAVSLPTLPAQPVAALTVAGVTMSLPERPGPDPVLMPVPAIVVAPSETQVGAPPMPQALACLVEVEAGGRRRPVDDRGADAPVVEDEMEIAGDAPVVDPDVLPASPIVAFTAVTVPLPVPVALQDVSPADPAVSAPPRGMAVQDGTAEVADPRRSVGPPDQAPDQVGVTAPSAALVAWQSVSQPAARDHVPGTMPAHAVKAEIADSEHGVTPFPGQIGRKAEAPLVDGVPVAVPVTATVVATRTVDHMAGTVAQGIVPSTVAERKDAVAAVAPTIPILTGAQPAAAFAPVAAQAVASPVVAEAGVAMPPAMAMLHDISALLAEPAAAAPQPAPVVAPAVVAAPAMLATQPAGAATVMVTATEPLRQGKRRDGAGGVVETAPSVESGVAVPVSAVAPVPTIQPTHVAGAVSVADPQPNGGMSAIPADAALGFHVDAARHGQELDQVARDIAATGQAGAPLSFKLDSHRLGSVAVELTQQAAGLHVRLESGDATARTILADQQQQLVTDARAAGVRIAETSVEAPRRDETASTQNGTAPRSDPSAGQTASGQSQGGQAGGHRGQGQPAQPAAAWSRGTRGGQQRTEQPAVTPRELYA